MPALGNQQAGPAATAEAIGRGRTGPIERRTARDVGLVLEDVAVPPSTQPGAAEQTRVVRRLDILAFERSTGRITQAQFLVGRMVQLVFERGTGARLGSATWSPFAVSNGSIAHDLSIILALDDAERIRRFTARLEAAIGTTGVRFLRAILVEGHTFKSYAALRGRSGELGVRSIAERFRFHLDDLTEAQQTATGPTLSPIRGGAC